MLTFSLLENNPVLIIAKFFQLLQNIENIQLENCHQLFKPRQQENMKTRRFDWRKSQIEHSLEVKHDNRALTIFIMPKKWRSNYSKARFLVLPEATFVRWRWHWATFLGDLSQFDLVVVYHGRSTKSGCVLKHRPALFIRASTPNLRQGQIDQRLIFENQ